MYAGDEFYGDDVTSGPMVEDEEFEPTKDEYTGEVIPDEMIGEIQKMYTVELSDIEPPKLLCPSCYREHYSARPVLGRFNSIQPCGECGC